MALSPLILQIIFIGCAGIVGLGAGGVLVSLNFSGQTRQGFEGWAEVLLGSLLGMGIGLLGAGLLSLSLAPAQLTRGILVILILMLAEFVWISMQMQKNS